MSSLTDEQIIDLETLPNWYWSQYNKLSKVWIKWYRRVKRFIQKNKKYPNM